MTGLPHQPIPWGGRARSALASFWVTVSLTGALPLSGGQTGATAPDSTTHAQKSAMTDSVFADLAGTAAPGCAIGVVHNGRLVFERGYGAANLDHGAPLDGRSSFYLASVSKQFIGAAIGLLALDGSITLDDDVRTYLPELPQYKHPIAIRHLLHHTSGVRDYLTLFSIAGRSFQDFFDNDDAIRLISRQGALNFAPGSEYLYSNSGYVLLSEIIERVSGQSLDAFSQERLFGPLGMYATHWGEDVSRVVPGRVVSYERRDDGNPHRFIWNFQGKGDGNLHSTVEDLARWDAMFYRTDEYWQPLVNLMYTRGVLNDKNEIPYALGLAHAEYRGRPTISHGGGMLGYRTFIMRVPEERFTTITLCNLASINPGVWGQKLTDIWLFGSDAPQEPAAPTVATEPAADGPLQPEIATVPDPADYAGEYYSEELDVTYVFTLRSEALFGGPQRSAPRELTYSEPDVFGVEGSVTISFERVDGRVAGFTLDAGRVRGLRFVRPEL